MSPNFWNILGVSGTFGHHSQLYGYVLDVSQTSASGHESQLSCILWVCREHSVINHSYMNMSRVRHRHLRVVMNNSKLASGCVGNQHFNPF